MKINDPGKSPEVIENQYAGVFMFPLVMFSHVNMTDDSDDFGANRQRLQALDTVALVSPAAQNRRKSFEEHASLPAIALNRNKETSSTSQFGHLLLGGYPKTTHYWLVLDGGCWVR